MDIVDTDVLIDIQRGYAPAVAWFAGSTELPLVPGFVVIHALGLLDALIAACAVGRSATLYTFNVKHYSAVPGLVVGQPYIR